MLDGIHLLLERCVERNGEEAVVEGAVDVFSRIDLVDGPDILELLFVDDALVVEHTLKQLWLILRKLVELLLVPKHIDLLLKVCEGLGDLLLDEKFSVMLLLVDQGQPVDLCA